MMRRLLTTSLAVVVISGCGGEVKQAAAPAAERKASAPTADYLLKEAPGGARSVIDVRSAAKDGEGVVVTGRIGGQVNPWVDGKAAFLIVDVSLKPCNESGDDACKTPWDYCCSTDQLPKALVMVKFVDDAGQTVATDARKLLGVKELQTVTVRGKSKRDEAGNVVVLAQAMFVKP